MKVEQHPLSPLRAQTQSEQSEPQPTQDHADIPYADSTSSWTRSSAALSHDLRVRSTQQTHPHRQYNSKSHGRALHQTPTNQRSDHPTARPRHHAPPPVAPPSMVSHQYLAQGAPHNSHTQSASDTSQSINYPPSPIPPILRIHDGHNPPSPLQLNTKRASSTPRRADHDDLSTTP